MKELKIGGFDHDDVQSPASSHHEEVNTLKIDKLSNRVTIISVIIPCIIGAIIVFGYLGMQETVIDVNNEKQSKILEITKQFEKKSNALDVKLAKMQSMLDKTLPEINKRIKKLDANLAKLSSKKADKKTVSKDIAKANANSAKYKAQIDSIEKATQSNTLLINDTISKYSADIAEVEKKLSLELTKIEDYETTVATTLKNLSILEKRYDEFKKNALTQKTLKKELDSMNKAIDRKLGSLTLKIAEPSNATPQSKPKENIVDAPIVEEAIEE
jgi:chromosome segregation ATPase